MIEANDIVRSNGIGESCGDHAEKLIAGVVAHRVVDQLETIQIDVEERELFSFPICTGEGARQAVVEITAVAEAGQFVDARASLGFGQSLHVFGHVFADGKYP